MAYMGVTNNNKIVSKTIMHCTHIAKNIAVMVSILDVPKKYTILFHNIAKNNALSPMSYYCYLSPISWQLPLS